MPRLNMPSRILGPAHVLRACAVLLCLVVLACSSGGGDESDSSATSSAGGGQGAGASSSDDGTLPLGAAWLPQTIGSFVPGNSAITGMTTTDGAAWVLGKRFNVPVVWRSTDGVSWTETEVAPSGEGVLTIEDIVDLPSGGLLGGGGLYTDCVEYDAPAGYRVLQLCRQSRPVFYRSDDDGASWRTIVPDAMASTVDTPNYYRDLAVHGDEVVAVTTVKGEDWRARVWSSSDGEQWTLASELRGVDYPMSVDQVISDGDAIVVLASEHPCSTPKRISEAGWVLGTSWAEHLRVFAGTDASSLTMLGPDDVSLAQAPKAYDCADVDQMTIRNESYTQAQGALVGGVITIVEVQGADEPPVREDRARTVARLVGGAWETATTPEIPAMSERWLTDLDGRVALLTGAGYQTSGRLRFEVVLPEGDSWVVPDLANYVLGTNVGGMVAFNGALLAAGTLDEHPFDSIVGGDASEVVIWRSTPTDAAELLSCKPGPGADCHYADFSRLEGFPDFTDIDLSDADLTLALLDRANFDGASFRGAQLVAVSATSATFVGADFSGANLTSSRLSRLEGVDFTGADLSYASISLVTDPVSLEGATMVGTSLASDSKLGEEYQRVEVSLANTDLTDARISGARSGDQLLVVTSLAGATIDSTRFDRVDLSQGDFAGVDLSGATFDEDSICPNGEAPTGETYVLTCE